MQSTIRQSGFLFKICLFLLLAGALLGRWQSFVAGQATATGAASVAHEQLKRGDWSAEALREAYRTAAQQVCRMPRVVSAQLPTAAVTADPVAHGWLSLGPAENSASVGEAASVDPCATNSQLPSFRAGSQPFVRGAVSADGKSYWGSALEQGLWRGSGGASPVVWQAVSKGMSSALVVDPTDAKVLYTAAGGLRWLKSTDGGASFFPAHAGVDDTGLLSAPLALSPQASQVLWTGGRRLWRSLDGAQHWAAVSVPLPDNARFSALALSAGDPQWVLAGTSAGHLLRRRADALVTTDTEVSFVKPRAGYVSSLVFHPHNPNLVYATYTSLGGAHVWRSYDAGASWLSLDGDGTSGLPDVPVHRLVIDPTNPARLFLATDLGVLVSLNAGANWAVEVTDFGARITEDLSLQVVDETTTRLLAATRGGGLWQAVLAPQQCSFNVTPLNQVFDAAGGAGSIAVTTSSGCNWPASSNVPWLTITSGATGTGSGTANFSVAANTGTEARTGVLSVAGQTVTVQQSGPTGSCRPIVIQSGQALNGALTPGDCRSSQRSTNYADRYTFSANQGELVSIALAGNFDAYLYLLGPNGNVLASDDDGGGSNGNSRIPATRGFFPLPATGTYLIEATSLSSNVIGNYTITFNLIPAGCTSYLLTAPRQTFESAGGPGTVTLNAGVGCPWTVRSNVNWITLTSPGNGVGTSNITFTVAANAAATARTGVLTIAEQSFTVEQAGLGGNCGFISLRSGEVVNGVLTTGDCRSQQGGSSTLADRYVFSGRQGELVTLTMNSSYNNALYLYGLNNTVVLSNTGGTSTRLPAGSGFYTLPATGDYVVEATNYFSNQTGTYSLSFTLVPPGCAAYSLLPESQSFNASGGTGTVQVAANSICPWQVGSSDDWLTVTSGTIGGGSLPVTYAVAPNAGPYRRGALSIAGQTFTVEQAGFDGNCLARPLASGQAVNSTLDSNDCRSRLRNNNFSGSNVYYTERFTVPVRAGQQLTLIATGPANPYLYLLSGSGVILNDGAGRVPLGSGSFGVPADDTYTVEVTTVDGGVTGNYRLLLDLQPVGCGFSVTPAAQTFEATGGAGTVTVNTGAACTWVASAEVSWIRVDSGASGTGVGTVGFTVAANTGNSYRRGTLTIAGRSVVIEQPGNNSTCAPQALTSGQSANGLLSDADCRSALRNLIDERGVYYAERYSFTGTAGQQIQLNISNSSFAPYLYLLAPNGIVLAEGRSPLPNANNSIVLPANGVYVVEVTSDFATGSGAYTLRLNTVLSGCAYVVTPGQLAFEPDASTSTISVGAPSGCPWQATSSVSWLQITEGASSSGSGLVKLAVAANQTTVTRRATLTVAGQIITLEQAGAGGRCSTLPLTAGQTINSTLESADCLLTERYSFNAVAGEQVVAIGTPATGSLTLRLLSASGQVLASGTNRVPASELTPIPATGSYFIEVAPNFSTPPQNYALTLNVVAATCAYALEPASQTFGEAGGTGSVSISAGANCPWLATSSASWLTLVPGSTNSGTGTLNFTVAANPTTTRRTANLSIGGRLFQVEQAGLGGSCSAQPLALGQTLNGNLSGADCLSAQQTATTYYADFYTIDFTEGQLLQLEVTGTGASSFTPRLYLTDPSGKLLYESPGNSNRVAVLPAANNFLTLPTSGRYLLEVSSLNSFSGGSYTVKLSAPTSCAYALTATSQLVEPDGGARSFKLVTGPACAWTASSSASWLALGGTTPGTGPATINYNVTLNNGSLARSGTLSVGGQTLEVEQAGQGGNCLSQPLVPNQLVQASLTPGDCRARYSSNFNSGSLYADRYSFNGKAGDRVALSILGSNQFSVTLVLVGPAETRLATTSSLILPGSGLLTLPQTGVYTVEYSGTVISDYSILLQLLPSGCAFAGTPSNLAFEFGGGTGSVAVSAGQTCTWQAVTTAPWITLTNSSAAGPSELRFEVALNNSLTARNATILLGEQAIQVQQAGVGGNCGVQTLLPNQLVSGQLTTADCGARQQSSSFASDRYRFDGTAGEQVTLRVLANNLSNFTFILLAPNGTELTRTNSLLVPPTGSLTLPATGVYTLELISAASNSANYQLLLTKLPAGCATVLESSMPSFGSAGGSGSVRVLNAAACPWMALPAASWITVVGSNSGTGSGEIKFNVAPNPSVNLRSTVLLIGGQPVAINQAGIGGNCEAVPLTPGQSVAGRLSAADCPSQVRTGSSFYADRYRFNAAANDQVLLTATAPSNSFSPRLRLTLFGPNGTLVSQSVSGTGTAAEARLPAGSGFLTLPSAGTYTLEVTTEFSNGSGSVTDYTLALQLSPNNCAYAISPARGTYEAAAQTSSFVISTGSTCPWNAQSSVPWLTLGASASGTGSGTLNFTLAANTQTEARSGTIAVGGLIFTVEQAGSSGTCLPVAITPGQTRTGNLNSGDCRSSLRIDTFVRADRYSFNGRAGERVSVTLTANNSSSPRLALFNATGRLLLSADNKRLPASGVFILPENGEYLIEYSDSGFGANYAIDLALQGACTYTVNPTTLEVEAAGGITSVNVTSAGGCDWNVVNRTPEWITVTAQGGVGSGPGLASFTVAPNPNPTARLATLTISGQTVTVRQLANAATVSSASFRATGVASNSLISVFGANFATSTTVATALPLPTTLAGVSINVRDTNNQVLEAPLLAVTPNQINLLMPAGTAAGDATLLIRNSSGVLASSKIAVSPIEPGVFSANSNGFGPAAGVALRVRNGVQSFEPLVRLDPMTNRYVAVPLDLGPEGDAVYLVLFGTGWRQRAALGEVSLQIGGLTAPVEYADAQGGFAGLDQLNVQVPRSLAGRGEVTLALRVAGKNANPVFINLR